MKRYLVIVIVIFCATTLAYGASGSIDPHKKYAWSENLGWINFSAQGGNIEVDDRKITGFAWSEATGWINLAPSHTTYVHNDGQGTLSGSAWGEGTGYIDFQGVTIDRDGFFHGYAYAPSTGRISFNCENDHGCAHSTFAVRTLWTFQSTASVEPVSSVPHSDPSVPAPVYSSSRSASPSLFLTENAIDTEKETEFTEEETPKAQQQSARISKPSQEQSLIQDRLTNNDNSASVLSTIKSCTGTCMWKTIFFVVCACIAYFLFFHRIKTITITREREH